MSWHVELPSRSRSCSHALAPTAELTGIYHLPNTIDAVVLELREDGTFRIGISGCDFGGLSQGKWRSEPGRVVLSPAEGEATFNWIDGQIFDNARETLELRGGPFDGEIIAIGVAQGDASDQTWLRGGVCAICGGPLGPTAPPEPCDAPFGP